MPFCFFKNMFLCLHTTRLLIGGPSSQTPWLCPLYLLPTCYSELTHLQSVALPTNWLADEGKVLRCSAFKNPVQVVTNLLECTYFLGKACNANIYDRCNWTRIWHKWPTFFQEETNFWSINQFGSIMFIKLNSRRCSKANKLASQEDALAQNYDPASEWVTVVDARERRLRI